MYASSSRYIVHVLTSLLLYVPVSGCQLHLHLGVLLFGSLKESLELLVRESAITICVSLPEQLLCPLGETTYM